MPIRAERRTWGCIRICCRDITDSGSSEFHQEWGEVPQAAGLGLAGHGGSGKSGQVEALYVLGRIRWGALKYRSVHVLKELRGRAGYFFDRDGVMADVVFTGRECVMRNPVPSLIPAAICNW